MFTTKIYTDTNRNNALMLRITNNRKKAELSLGFQMSEETLADSLSAKPRSENLRYRSLLVRWQLAIDDLKIRLANEGRTNEDVKVLKNEIQNALFGESHGDGEDVSGKCLFADYFRGFADGKANSRTNQIYYATLSRMRAFDANLEKLKFEDITIRWLTDFDNFLTKTSPSQNARNIHFRNIRTVINAAIDEELTTHYPFRRFKIRATPTRKRSLSVENIRKVFDADGLEEWEIKYLDFFKLSFMLIGINVVDLCNLDGIIDGRIGYVRAKTHKPYSIKVEPEAMEIIERYRGKTHLLSFTDNYANYRHFYNNLCKGLGSIKTKLGIKELTTYWARHTWATVARSIGVSIDDIALALGHGDGHDLTHIYLDEDLQKIDEANRRVLDWVLYGKE